MNIGTRTVERWYGHAKVGVASPMPMLSVTIRDQFHLNHKHVDIEKDRPKPRCGTTQFMIGQIYPVLPYF